VLVTVEPRFAVVEPERSPIELAVARVEPAIDPVGARAIMLIDTGVSPLDTRVCTVHAGLTAIEVSLEPVVVRCSGCD
jgi:hypothetical protein